MTRAYQHDVMIDHDCDRAIMSKSSLKTCVRRCQDTLNYTRTTNRGINRMGLTSLPDGVSDSLTGLKTLLVEPFRAVNRYECSGACGKDKSRARHIVCKSQ